MSVLDGLPAAYERLLREVAAEFGDEPRATCGDCALKPRPGVPEGAPWAPVFSARARCCTYHPRLPAHLVGRALRRGGEGAARIRARLHEPDGVSAEGIRPHTRHREAYATGGGFGVDDALTCPYWSEAAPEGRGCSIHADRDAICRTWHCKREQGARGHAAWLALRDLMTTVQATLVEVAAPEGPPGEGASVEAWEAWFLACADAVDALAPDVVDALRGERYDVLVAAVRARVAERDVPMPDIVIPTVRAWARHQRGVTLCSWAGFDPIDTPSWIFQLLARLDGHTPWREAAAATEAEVGEPVADLVVTLYRRAVLGPPEHVDVSPGLTVLPSPQ
ncbi:MAG: hypothetical protein R3F59_10585 [Myxococcota bacterium]